MHKKIAFLIFSLLLLAIININTASNNYFISPKTVSAKTSDEKIKKKYLKWLKKHQYTHLDDTDNYTRADVNYVDVDGNGTKEMIYSSYIFGHVVLTYDRKSNRVKKLYASGGNGRGGYAYYNKKKHMIALSNSTTGTADTYFYKLTSKKLVKKKVFKYYREDIPNGSTYTRTYKYSINGKLYSNSKYNKLLKKALKGYKLVTPH